MTLAKVFAEKFALASVDGEDGVLLDLVTGEYYRVDRQGVIVCRALSTGGGVSGAGAALASQFEVSQARAEADVRLLLASFRLPARRRRPKQPVAFRVSGGGFDLVVGRRRSLHVDRATGRVDTRTCTSADLRLIAPHVLALQGRAVLHASAVRLGSKLVAFVGPSGVGKTTIARILKSTGAGLVSRDLVVMADARRALLDGEGAIATWSRQRARTIHASPLGVARDGPSARVAAILLVERASPSSPLRIDALAGAGAIAALLENAFVELPDPRVWRSALATCGALAAQGIVRRARVPEGRDALRRVLRAWVAAGADVRPRT